MTGLAILERYFLKASRLALTRFSNVLLIVVPSFRVTSVVLNRQRTITTSPAIEVSEQRPAAEDKRSNQIRRM